MNGKPVSRHNTTCHGVRWWDPDGSTQLACQLHNLKENPPAIVDAWHPMVIQRDDVFILHMGWALPPAVSCTGRTWFVAFGSWCCAHCSFMSKLSWIRCCTILSLVSGAVHFSTEIWRPWNTLISSSGNDFLYKLTNHLISPPVGTMPHCSAIILVATFSYKWNGKTRTPILFSLTPSRQISNREAVSKKRQRSVYLFLGVSDIIS